MELGWVGATDEEGKEYNKEINPDLMTKSAPKNIRPLQLSLSLGLSVGKEVSPRLFYFKNDKYCDKP